MEEIINLSYLYYNKALDYIEKNNISRAKEELEKAVSLYSKDIEILNLLGLCEYYLCNFNSADAYWKRSINISDENNIANKYITSLNSDEFKGVIKNYNIGLDFLYDGKYKEAVKIFKSILEYESNFIEVYEILIISYDNMDDKKNLIKYIKLLNNIDSGSQFSNNYKTLLKEEKDNNQEKKIININNIDSEREKKKKKKITAVALTLIISLSGLNIFSYNKYKMKNQEMISVEKELVQSKENYSKLLKESEDAKEIASDAKIALNDNSGKIIFEMQKIYENYYRDKKYDEAIKGFNYLLEYANNDAVKADAVYYLAAINFKRDNIEETKKYYEKYINEYSKENSCAEVLYNYAIILNKENNIEKSKELAFKLKTEYPNSIYNNSKIENILK